MTPLLPRDRAFVVCTKFSLANILARVLPSLCAALVPILSGCLCGVFFFAVPALAPAQSLDKPSTTIDEDITAFAFAPDGRIVYSVRRMYRNKKYDMQRDDIWIQDAGGKRKRIFQGEHFTVANPIAPRESERSSDDENEKGKKGKKDKADKDRPTTPPFTYLVEGFSFSPNGRMVLVQLLTSTIMDESSHQQDERMTLVLDESGREIKLSGDNAVIHEAKDATWLKDNSTIVYLSEAVKPNLLFSFRYANIRTGPAGPAFEGRTFIASAPIPHTNSTIAIERDRNLSGPPRLQRLELLAQDDKELATLDGYETGLSVSPSGKHVAYFIDKEVLEIRDLEHPNRLARVRIGLGAVQWSGDESYLLVKRSPERKSGDLVCWWAKSRAASAVVKYVRTILLTFVCSRLRAITGGAQAKRKSPPRPFNFLKQRTTAPIAALSIVVTAVRSKITRVCFSSISLSTSLSSWAHSGPQ